MSNEFSVGLPTPRDELDEFDYSDIDSEELLDVLTDIYKVYETKREYQGDYYLSNSLWIVDGGEEFPVIVNTGGFNSVFSKSPEVADGITELNEEFFNIISYGYHHVMAFGGSKHIWDDGFDETMKDMEGIFEYILTDGERRIVGVILNQMAWGEKVVPELMPIVEYTDRCTEFNLKEVFDER